MYSSLPESLSDRNFKLLVLCLSQTTQNWSSWKSLCSFRYYFILLCFTILCSGTQTLGDVNCWQNCLNLPFLLDTRWALVARQYGNYKVNINHSDNFHMPLSNQLNYSNIWTSRSVYWYRSQNKIVELQILPKNERMNKQISFSILNSSQEKK